MNLLILIFEQIHYKIDSLKAMLLKRKKTIDPLILFIKKWC